MIELSEDERRIVERAGNPARPWKGRALLVAAVVAVAAGLCFALYADKKMRDTFDLAGGPAADAAYERALNDLRTAGLLDEAIRVGEVEARVKYGTGLFTGWISSSMMWSAASVAGILIPAGLALLGRGAGAKRDRLILKLHAASEERAAATNDDLR